MNTANPIHQPCPDLPCYSLTHDQKARGLEILKQVRANLGNKQAERLRTQAQQEPSRAKRAALLEQAKHFERHWCLAIKSRRKLMNKDHIPRRATPPPVKQRPTLNELELAMDYHQEAKEMLAQAREVHEATKYNAHSPF